MLLATLVDGHGDLAEWALLFATIAFVAAGLLTLSGRTEVTPATTGRAIDLVRLNATLVAFGLALVALAFLVL